LAHLDTDGSRFLVHTEYRERDLIKSVPGARWNNDERVWVAPLSWGSAQALRGVFGQSLTLSEATMAWGAQYANDVVNPALALKEKQDAAVDGWYGADQLWPHQRVGVEFLRTTGAALLADEMGLGKTVQLIEATRQIHLHKENALPLLVICPNSLKWNWKRELERWWPELRAEVVSGTASKRRKTLATVGEDIDAAIINWEALRLHSRLAPFGSTRLQTCEVCDEASTRKIGSCERCPKELNAIAWGTVIADEAHRAKEPKAKQTRALWQVAHDARYRFLATGTPLANTPEDFWSLAHTMAPEDWPAKGRYIDRYCTTSYNPFGGLTVTGLNPATKDEFFRILDYRFLRRTKAEVIEDLPEKIYQTRPVEMSDKQAKAYTQMRDLMVAQLEGGTVMSFDGLTVLTRLLQFASAHAMVETETCGCEIGCDDCTGGVIQKVRLQEPSSKIDALVDLIDESSRQPMVVFAVSKQLINLASTRLAKLDIPHGVVTGDVKDQARQDVLDGFQAGEFPILLATVGAISEGVTLTRAQIAVFMQRSYSLIQNKQAEDRVYARVNDIHGATIIDLVSVNTVEERVFNVLRDKADLLQEVTRDRERLLRLVRGE
jgi:SNF2 family DNA or RNA helicase